MLALLKSLTVTGMLLCPGASLAIQTAQVGENERDFAALDSTTEGNLEMDPWHAWDCRIGETQSGDFFDMNQLII